MMYPATNKLPIAIARAPTMSSPLWPMSRWRPSESDEKNMAADAINKQAKITEPMMARNLANMTTFLGTTALSCFSLAEIFLSFIPGSFHGSDFSLTPDLQAAAWQWSLTEKPRTVKTQAAIPRGQVAIAARPRPSPASPAQSQLP